MVCRNHQDPPGFFNRPDQPAQTQIHRFDGDLSRLEKVKLIIVTNADFRARADAANVKDLDGRPVTLSVWDLKRLKQYMEQGQARANLIIDFDRDFGGGVPLLAASGSDSALESPKAVISTRRSPPNAGRAGRPPVSPDGSKP